MNSSHLFESYPLPKGWTIPEVFFEVQQMFEVDTFFVGFSCSKEDLFCTAAAADFNYDSAVYRAYFELIERVSIYEARNDKSQLQRVGSQEKIPYLQVFPEGTQEWSYSLSNGVASEKSIGLACMAARFELIERSVLLESWFLSKIPIKEPFREALDKDYDAYYVCFQENAPFVFGCFAIPKNPEKVIYYGFGCSHSKDNAVYKAKCELIQKYGFLKEEEHFSEIENKFSPTPDFHQEYFLRPKGQSELRAWLSGKFYPASKVKQMPYLGTFQYFDLTPECLKDRLSVVKAKSDGMIPLTFGKKHPWIIGECEHSIHPVS